MSVADQNQLLHWLESGRHPQDRVVLNHMIYALTSQTQGRDTARLLTVFDNLPDRNKNWWILTPLEDASALPLLSYYATLPAPKDQREELVAMIRDLQRKHIETEKHVTCCQPTEACLRSMLNEESNLPAEIRSEAQARGWLKGVVSSKATYLISFSGPLQRVATVHRAGKDDQRWEYLYDCWHRTDATASRVFKQQIRK
jgi:hypothetical protein